MNQCIYQCREPPHADRQTLPITLKSVDTLCIPLRKTVETKLLLKILLIYLIEFITY